jgi:hypothetical protein
MEKDWNKTPKWQPVRLVKDTAAYPPQKDNKNLYIPPPPMFWFIQALQHNEKFKEYILDWRKQLGLPANGLSEEIYMEEWHKKIEQGEDYAYPVKNELLLIKELFSIREKYHIENMLAENFYNIILYGVIEPYPLHRVSISHNDNNDSHEVFNISKMTINLYNNISQTALIEIIKGRWAEISRLMNNLPSDEGITFNQSEIDALNGTVAQNKQSTANDFARPDYANLAMSKYRAKLKANALFCIKEEYARYIQLTKPKHRKKKK